MDSNTQQTVEPAGFDMRNALSSEDVVFPISDGTKTAETWGRMMVADREASMWRAEFGPLNQLQAVTFAKPWQRPVSVAEYVRAGILAAQFEDQAMRSGAIY